MTTPYAPVSSLFGYELNDPIANAKSIQKQLISALGSNSKVVTLPTLTPDGGNSPQDQIVLTNKAIMACMVTNSIPFTLPTFATFPVATAGVQATKVLSSVTPVALITLTAKVAGLDGNVLQVKVETGGTSGKKVTVKYNAVTWVYDNQADVPAVVASINADATSRVTATQLTTGTLVNVAYAKFAGGLDGAEADVRSVNDRGLDTALKTLGALVVALRTAGYLY